MKNIKGYKVFESTEEEEGTERLALLIDYNRSMILKFFSDKGMDSDFVAIEDPEEFIMEYWPRSLDGSISNRISYYIDEFRSIISKELKTGIEWRFGPNGNVQRLIFTLDNPISQEYYDGILKYIETKEKLKY
jgi:hypothetical protein